MDEQKVLPSSLPEKRYPCSSQLVGLRRSFTRICVGKFLSYQQKVKTLFRGKEEMV
jgi:hypothetical protein